MFVHADEEAEAIRLLRRTFGIVSISPAREAPSELAALTDAAVAYAREVLRPKTSFAIRARRSGQHPYTSHDLAVSLGRAIQEAIPDLAVDLERPDRKIHVEVRERRAFVFADVLAGPGGMPIGTQGEIVAAVEGDASLVAAWMLMRRGCRVAVSGTSELIAALRRWDPRLETVDGARPKASGTRLRATVSAVPTKSPDGTMVLTPTIALSAREVQEAARAIRAA
jgi:thiamine biosynthesis protein ThiI